MFSLYAKYGQPGSAIPNSRMFRSYCPGCGEPMRVTNPDAAVNRECLCLDCGDSPVRSMVAKAKWEQSRSPGQRAKSYKINS